MQHYSMTLPPAVIINLPKLNNEVKETVAAIAPKLCEGGAAIFSPAQLIDMNLFGEFDRFLFLDAAYCASWTRLN